MSRYPGRILSSTAPTVNANTAKGIWTLDEALRYSRAGQWPVPTGNGDPYFQYNTMLLPGQGTTGMQNHSFLDSSSNNFTVNRSGNTTQGTFTPFSGANGNWSNFFDGTSSYLTGGAGSGSLGSGNFTVEAFVYATSTPQAYNTIFSNYTAYGTTVALLYFSSDSKVNFVANNTTITSTAPLQLNTWNHVAAVRNSGTITLYVNGVVQATLSYSGSSSGSGVAYVGTAGDAPTTTEYTGFISNLRVVAGSAVYTSAFTPPTSPLTAISNTIFLTCQSNRFVDNSTNAYSVTSTGSPSVTPFQPFGAPTTAYSASTIGGSGYFDGSGDYLTIADNSAMELSNNNFTIEFWIYTNSSVQYDCPFSREPGNTSGSFACLLNIASATSGDLAFYSYDYNSFTAPMLQTTGVNIRDNAWHHVALVRNGSSWVIYVDGVSRATQTSSMTIGNGTADYYIASNQSYATRDLQAYISGFRWVVGTAVYTTGFTPPTAPPTNIANTALLLNFTNAGIIDNAQDNNLETVGNAQISTTQYKWGASSMYFDGTSDYLKVPSSQNLVFNTGDFTLETWIYLTATGASDGAIIDLRGSGATSTGFAWTTRPVSGGYKLNFYTDSAANLGSTTISYSTWNHVVVTRTAGTVKMYVNGNLDMTVAKTNNFSDAPVVTIGESTLYSGSNITGYLADFRATKGFCRYPYNFTAPTAALPLFYQAAATPSADPYFEYTTLLLPGNGTNGAQNNTFLDSGTANGGVGFPVNRSGNTTQGTFTPFSQTGWSNSLANKGYFTFTGTSAFSLDGDFTLECWVYLNSYVGSSFNELSVFNNRSGLSTGTQIDIGNSASGNPGNVAFWHNGSTILSASSGTVQIGQWTHLAFVRSGTGVNNFKFYVNGVMTSQASSTATFFGSSGTFYIGQTIYDQPFNNTISNFRITKGGALYTSNFIPSTTPLTTTVASGTVSLLTCQSNRFVDNSASPVTLTPVTSPSVQAFSPFNPTAAYSTSTVGGSGYFDGTGDNLTVATNSALSLGASDFTVEAWIYPTASATQGIIGFGNGATVQPYIYLDGLTPRFLYNSINVASGPALIQNSWNHVAVTRSGSTIRVYTNGTSGTAASPYSDTFTNAGLFICSSNLSSQYLSGYVSSLRVVPGTAVYTGSTLTVPTSPATAISGTAFLANFTNGGIIDNTAKNNLETVGGASISTTVSKFGGSSMYFDGSGDYLSVPHSALQNMAGGDITIECWVYVSAKSNCTFFAKGSGASNWEYFLGYDGTTLSLFYNGNTSVTMTDTISLNTWTHVAMSRYGSSLMVFINGVRAVNATYSGTTTYTNPLGVGAAIPLAGSGYVMNGYIQDFRLTKGIARYTTNFTPPTTAFLTL